MSVGNFLCAVLGRGTVCVFASVLISAFCLCDHTGMSRSFEEF